MIFFLEKLKQKHFEFFLLMSIIEILRSTFFFILFFYLKEQVTFQILRAFKTHSPSGVKLPKLVKTENPRDVTYTVMLILCFIIWIISLQFTLGIMICKYRHELPIIIVIDEHNRHQLNARQLNAYLLRFNKK